VEEIGREHADGLGCAGTASSWCRLCRTGAGGIRWRWRIHRIGEAPTRWPSLSMSPCLLRYPQVGFSVAIPTTSAARASSMGGRPDRFG
jgi:hypothetical protein